MTHANRSHPVLPTSRAISPATIKIPEPIIDPATIMVESKTPRLRFNSRWGVATGEISTFSVKLFASWDSSLKEYHSTRFASESKFESGLEA
jgi:hypothetical protein